MTKNRKELISIVVPCYNEQESLPIFYKEISKVIKEMKEVDFELLFINDGSKDKTLEILRDLSKKDKKVRFISFSRNFGKEAGIYAGLSNATGDFIATMDADLQDPPAMIKEMYKALKEEDYDCVALYTKSHEGYSFIRKTLTNCWYKFIDKISTSHQMPGARDFRLMTRQMLDSILSLPEYNRYTKGIFGFVGFNTKWISYDAPDRVAGTTKFNLVKLIKYALEGIVAFSTSPLMLSAYLGLIFCFLSFVAIIIIIVKTLIWGDPVGGWPSMACLVVFLGGVQLLFLGIIGLYLSKIYLEVKHRPIYIEKENEKSGKENEK